MTLSTPFPIHPKSIYIAGPMSGIPDHNFPAFDDAAERFRSLGWHVVNPAEMERVSKDDRPPDNIPIRPDQYRVYMLRDLSAICSCTAIALLPGWEKSRGVKVELALARLINLDILDGVTALTFSPDKSVCLEADRLTTKDRRDEYGHPFVDFSNISKLWSIILSTDITPEQVGLCMIALKMARLFHNPSHRDSKVDIAGYANCLDMIQKRREELKEVKSE